MTNFKTKVEEEFSNQENIRQAEEAFRAKQQLSAYACLSAITLTSITLREVQDLSSVNTLMRLYGKEISDPGSQNFKKVTSLNLPNLTNPFAILRLKDLPEGVIISLDKDKIKKDLRSIEIKDGSKQYKLKPADALQMLEKARTIKSSSPTLESHL